MTSTITGYRKSINNWFREYKTQVDVLAGEYTEHQAWFGLFKFKHKKPLPKTDYVLVFRALYAKCEPCDIKAGGDNDNAFFQVSLVHHKSRRIIVHETKNAAEAFEFAQQLGNTFSLRIRDSATALGKSKWLPQTENYTYTE